MALDVGKLAIVTQAWQVFTYHASPAMFRSNTSSGVRNLENQEFENCVRALCDQGLAQLVVSYFLDALERVFKEQQVAALWEQLDEYTKLNVDNATGTMKGLSNPEWALYIKAED